MVNIPKSRSAYCSNLKCRKHTPHRVSQHKKGKDTGNALGSRRYRIKQKGFGGQSKPILRRKAKTTKKIILKLECTKCKSRRLHPLKRCKTFELGGEKKPRGEVNF
ncbi:ribosomal protein RPL44 [Cardiosporidium cionae]|uniref:Ribosomal protein RPL44 n=1 Tax=Cardiosporidium cionae TaxID=476202 RepID=A0ABQ7J7T5_9APIC|nr:ribosomal protein RPL44 [Cardiosporidium cionae]|eukprot:KAF8820047.1 ribosomal protein RPL44 [Cardiosporidium cionae]